MLPPKKKELRDVDVAQIIISRIEQMINMKRSYSGILILGSYDKIAIHS